MNEDSKIPRGEATAIDNEQFRAYQLKELAREEENLRDRLGAILKEKNALLLERDMRVRQHFEEWLDRFARARGMKGEFVWVAPRERRLSMPPNECEAKWREFVYEFELRVMWIVNDQCVREFIATVAVHSSLLNPTANGKGKSEFLANAVDNALIAARDALDRELASRTRLLEHLRGIAADTALLRDGVSAL